MFSLVNYNQTAGRSILGTSVEMRCGLNESGVFVNKIGIESFTADDDDQIGNMLWQSMIETKGIIFDEH